MSIYRLSDRVPEIAQSAWIAPGAQVIGRVILGERTSVWFGAVLRGDNEHIAVGDNTNVQEGAVLHTDAGIPLTVGAGVTVGHQAMLHGCTVGDGSLIGIQAVVLNNAIIGCECLVGAGALVTEGKSFPDGSLIIGSPARLARALTAAERQSLRESAAHYVKRGELFRTQLQKIDSGVAG
jgi:carbonic anhydrase/acetyltransferase-like protein (isoleucine patch superfamily)